MIFDGSREQHVASQQSSGNEFRQGLRSEHLQGRSIAGGEHVVGWIHCHDRDQPLYVHVVELIIVASIAAAICVEVTHRFSLMIQRYLLRHRWGVGNGPRLLVQLFQPGVVGWWKAAASAKRQCGKSNTPGLRFPREKKVALPLDKRCRQLHFGNRGRLSARRADNGHAKETSAWRIARHDV